jgi:SAM-dependent methyltransferase
MDSAEWDARYAGAEVVWSAEPNRFVEQECRSLPPGRALDVAAGEGRNAIWLAGLGWQVVAVDFSAVALAKGQRIAERLGVAEAVAWVRADVRTWVPIPEAFDLVVVAYLHLPAADRLVVLEHAVTGLAPGGTLVVVSHDRVNLVSGVGGPQDPSVLYGPEDLIADLAFVGELTVERAATLERPTPAGTALDALVRARRQALPAGRAQQAEGFPASG